MTEISFLFDFTRVDTFIEQLNLTYKMSEMDGDENNPNFEMVFCSDSPNNIRDCLTTGGGLNSDVTIAPTSTPNVDAVIDCALKWENDTISLGSELTWSIGNSPVPLKAIFIRHKASGYVMGYCIHIAEFTVTNQIVFDEGTAFWRFVDE